jgi:sarcosine oxidase gamma subunit
MDAPQTDDPLARLAAELEKLSEAQLKLTAATEDLLLISGPDQLALRSAVEDTQAAARASADASARVQTAADERSGRFSR